MNHAQLTTRLDRTDPEVQANLAALDVLVEHLRRETATARLGGPAASRDRHTVKSHLRAQEVALENRLPCIYLVEAHPGMWAHGDLLEITEHGGLVISGRSDATLNRAGVCMGTAEIDRVVEGVPGVVDSLVVHLEDGDRLILLVGVEPGADDSGTTERSGDRAGELKQAIKSKPRRATCQRGARRGGDPDHAVGQEA